MEIYLRHPVHGTKVATLELEAAYDVSNGWERFDPTHPAAEMAVIEAEPEAPAPVVENALAPTGRVRRRVE